jgi:protease-4
MDSAFTPFTPDQLQKLNANVETIYEGFVQRVADGRRMPAGTIAQSAQGRVWTGQQAKQLGLIDSLGGLEEAIGVAREVAGIPADEATVVHVYPEPLTPIETLRAVFAGDGGVETELNAEIDAALSAMRGPAGLVARAFAPLFREPRDEGARMPALGPVN